MVIPSVSPPTPPVDATNNGSIGGGGSVAAFGSIGSFNKSQQHHSKNSGSYYNLNSSSEADAAYAAHGGFEVAMGLAGATPPLLQRAQKPLAPADQRRARRALDAASNLSAASEDTAATGTVVEHAGEGGGSAATSTPADVAAAIPPAAVAAQGVRPTEGATAAAAAAPAGKNSTSALKRTPSPIQHRGSTKWTSPAVTPPAASVQQTSQGNLLVPADGSAQVPVQRNISRRSSRSRPSRSRDTRRNTAMTEEGTSDEDNRDIRGLRFDEIVPKRGSEAMQNLKFGGICGPYLV